MPRPIEYSQQELDFIRLNQLGVSRQKLTEKFNLRFGRNISVSNIHGLCKRKGWKNGIDCQFKKGQSSWNKDVKGYIGANKTSFRKGRLPHNHKPIGHERISDGYIMIKIAEPNKFVMKHKFIWEKSKGKIPKNHCLRFLDGNRLNCILENLECIPKAVNSKINNTKSILLSANPKINKGILLTETLNYHINKMEKRIDRSSD